MWLTHSGLSSNVTSSEWPFLTPLSPPASLHPLTLLIIFQNPLLPEITLFIVFFLPIKTEASFPLKQKELWCSLFFFYKGQTIDIWEFEGSTVSVTTIQLCHCWTIYESHHGQYINVYTWLCSNKTLFTKNKNKQKKKTGNWPELFCGYNQRTLALEYCTGTEHSVNIFQWINMNLFLPGMIV